MEKEFSFKNYFKYILKKWIVIVSTIILCVATMLVVRYVQKPTNYKVYEGSIRFNIDEYAKADRRLSPEGSQEFNQSIISIYELKASRVIDLMMNDALLTDVYEKKVENILYPSLSPMQKNIKFFNNFSVTNDGMILVARFVYNVKNHNDVIVMKDVVDTYLDNALMVGKQELGDNFAEYADNILRKSSAIENRNYVTISKIFDISMNEKISITKAIVLGLIFGIILSVVVVSIIYVCDKRIKSFSGFKDDIGHIIAKIKDINNNDDREKNCVKIDALSTLHNVKTLLISSVVKDDIVLDFVHHYALHCAEIGKKVLVIDCIKSSEGANLKNYLLGSDLSTVVQHKEYDIIPNSNNQWKMLLNKKDRFNELKQKYDIILFALSNENDGGLNVIANICDTSILIIDQTKTKYNQLVKVYTDILNSDCNIMGNIVYNITDSFVD